MKQSEKLCRYSTVAMTGCIPDLYYTPYIGRTDLLSKNTVILNMAELQLCCSVTQSQD